MVFDRPPSFTDHHSSRGRKRAADDVWEGSGVAAGGANKRAAPEPGRRSQDGGFTRGLSSSSSSSRSSRLTCKEIWHGQVCKVYASYSRLLRSSPKTDNVGDGQMPPPSTEDLQDFQRILAAASPEGSCASRRLASRLVPKFVPQFPTLVDTCATALITLHQGRWHPESLSSALDGEQQRQLEQQQEDIIRATREDALTGLGEVLHASMRLVDKAVPTVLRIVDFLFRQLHACTSAAAEAAAQPPSLKRSHQQASSPSPEPLIPTPASNSYSNNSTLAIVQEVLKLAFKLYPRVVLSCCLQSFKGQDRVMFQVCHLETCACGMPNENFTSSVLDLLHGLLPL
ncbi:hypothetical protein DUNSADRAFT_8303 [Dunaliella salina]|uniref:Uncharacterized protein n=1 Tax=Dunaliella salina TaxID=3046 RepID=A0ABQ7H5U8_DUNSA|nr:hypothetical protein DUNSADRAFT_8303 [Dunaliella salina]|eukprot:KAF5842240.1 hypothetical protein DUNSADRAFT_8303 [Dunaliella salina]